MKFFSKKETLIENIAFFGLMAAINVIFVVLTTFIPILLVILVIFLTFSSTFVTLFCKKIYFPIFLFATLLICLLINLSDSLFFVTPSLLTGFIFGLMIEKKVPQSILLVLSTLIQIAFTYISYFIINAVFGVSIVDTLFIVFKITSFEYKQMLIAPFIFVISFAQVLLSYIAIIFELPKLGIELDGLKSKLTYDFFGILASILVMILSIFVYKNLTYLFLLFAMLFSIDIVILIIKTKHVLSIAILGISIFLGLILVAVFYAIIPSPFKLTLIAIYALLVILVGFINKYLLKVPSEYKIN